MIAWTFPNGIFHKIRPITLIAIWVVTPSLPAKANGLLNPNTGLSLGMTFGGLIGAFLLTGLITALLDKSKNHKPSFKARTAFWLVYFLAFLIAVVLNISFNPTFNGENSDFHYAHLIISSLFLCLIMPAGIAAIVFRMITKPPLIKTK
jgi:uncharacterized membrane protein YozB (DUF420 family)